MVDSAAEGLGQTPEALAKRQATVKLSDGTTVVVRKWSVMKHPELLPRIGLLAEVPFIAEQSVAEADREKVRKLEFEDLLEISTAATALNVTPGILKNLPTLLEQRKGLEAAVMENKAPSKVS